MSSVFEIKSLRGGLDDTTPHVALEPDACVTAENVELVDSMLGERRRGCSAITLSANFANATLDGVVWMYRHLPSNTQLDAQLWAIAASLTTTNYIIEYRNAAGWNSVSPIDTIDVTNTQGHKVSGQTLHGKLFLGHKSTQDRLHVWDGTSLRRTGLAEPAAPTAANTGVGAINGARFYRVRYLKLSGSTVLLKSEPSDTLQFIPSGTGAAVRITKPASIGEGETHWEVEASMDISGGVNPEPGDFYTISGSRQIVATTTYDDTIDYDTYGAEAYAQFPNELADDVGMYTVIPSGKYLSADEDRLLIAGSWENSAEASRVRWTPVFADPTGVGNDERLDTTTDPYLDLDGFEGGEITGISRVVSGYIYVFKRSHIYKLIRTNSRNPAYEAVPLTKARGALPGSLVEAVNQAGQPSIYFLDQTVGLTRLSGSGLQWCGRDIQNIWARVNVNAKVPCHGIYYSKKRQLHYWLAVDGAEYPNFKVVLHVNEMRDTPEGARRGWVTVAKNNRIATAHCSGMFADNTDSAASRTFNLVPYIGKEKWTVGANTIRNYIQKCDTGGTDAHTTDDTDSDYRATITSKPFTITSILQEHEIQGGFAVIHASAEPNGLVFFRATRNFGAETKTVEAQFVADNDETHIIAPLGSLSFSELRTLQISIGDLDTSITPPDEWAVDLIQLKVLSGNRE